ncbi:orotidine-5'-phosphate decarboxylase [Algisphaera agarilytica]|uniref:Orotidine 5'-phosphate decarboxylase n=1 Tax=Algisphaera agarilytica TaxID=1385975 RepID=A0A7X0LL82_9BACT|nr:orotidine-5'-phosphate decarboxylase [Algisphaera agarilytica]MBB6431235.1 orotidine-5'-phosphate decarboxylase [Algisphaera agarilytica]
MTESDKTHHAADRLIEACRSKGAPVCVGIDPVLNKLPDSLGGLEPIAAIEKFSLEVIEAVAEHVPAIKPQIACFERYGSEGYAVYERVATAGREAGLFVIGDAKRGDIGTSSAHYASGLLVGEEDSAVGCDALTVNTYLGMDGIEPFFKAAAATGKGLFALVRTSNPGGDKLQGLRLEDGRSVAEAVADQVADLGCGELGSSGYSLLGAVVGATKPEDAVSLRQRMPQQIFLVPGFGAQGGSADDVRACFKPDGTGAIITASRSVIYAYNPADTDWPDAVTQAAIDLKRQIAEILS